MYLQAINNSLSKSAEVYSNHHSHPLPVDLNVQFKKILIIDENNCIDDHLIALFNAGGYSTKLITETDRLDERIDDFGFNIMIISPAIPYEGIALCRHFSTQPFSTVKHICLISNKDEEEIEVEAFEAGVNDYIVLPVRPRALVKRINVFMEKFDLKIIHTGNFTLNPSSYNVSVRGQKITLTKKEFELLYFFVQHPNKIFKREEIFEKIWHNIELINDRTVDVHINRLREKIGKESIQTVIRVGYKFMNL